MILKIKFKPLNDKEYEKYYCKKYKGQFVLSSQEKCALKFKNVRSLKRSMNIFKKKYGNHLSGYGDILEYNVV